MMLNSCSFSHVIPLPIVNQPVQAVISYISYDLLPCFNPHKPLISSLQTSLLHHPAPTQLPTSSTKAVP